MRDALIDDMVAENAALDTVVAALPNDAWDRPTAFFGWTVRDQILHLYQVDRFGLMSLTGPAPFGEIVAAVRAHQARGIELSQAIREEFAGVPSRAVLDAWRDGRADLAAALREAADGRRLDWFGPPMGIASFASARIMEVWAHGQDIVDALGERRAATDRLRHVCELGVRTFAWSFRNRALDVPARPEVRLTAPRGGEWSWDGEGGGRVTGSALDFALVVTQRRAPSDTTLRADGESARHWLDIAQCFAGAPQQPAAPGSRPPA